MSRERPWAAVVAATCVNLPLGSLYAFSVLLKPMEQLFAATRSELSMIFALATISFTVGMNAAPRLYGAASAPVLVALCALCSTLGIALTAGAGGVEADDVAVDQALVAANHHVHALLHHDVGNAATRAWSTATSSASTPPAR